MAFRFYNTNDVGAPQDSSSAALPNGFVRVDTFDAYKNLREKELALHRLLCEVFTMHNGFAQTESDAKKKASTDVNASIAAAVVPAPTSLTRAQRRILEDLRDELSIPEETTEIELLAAATNPSVVKVAGTGVAKARAMFYDGVDDVPLSAPVVQRVAGVGQTADDGGRLACAQASMGSPSTGRPMSPQPQTATATAGPSSPVGAAAAAVAVDPSRMYMSDLAALEKEVRALIKEVLSENTSEARRVLVHAALKDKRQVLVTLKNTLTS